MDNDEDDLYAECASCNGGVLRSAAFKEGRLYYHPDCAGVWRCHECGEWNEKGKPCMCEDENFLPF